MQLANSAKRALCLWLPRWPLQRLYKTRPELRQSPLVIYEEYRPGMFRVVDCSESARQQGVKQGLPLAEASVLCKAQQEQYDPDADRKTLEELAVWCERFSPAVAIQEPDCLLMDVTGLTHFFGGEQALATEIQRDFAKQSLVARIAIGDSFVGAWGAVHFADRAVTVLPPGSTLNSLGSLPVAALQLDDDTLGTLAELGIDTIGQLSAIPRASLAARFDSQLLRRLDQATGIIPETIHAYRPPAEIFAEREWEHPIADRSILETTIAELLAEIAPQLATEQRGVAAFDCEFQSELRHSVWLKVRLYQATADTQHLAELAKLQLERVRFAEPIIKVRLSVRRSALLSASQRSFTEELGAGSNQRELSQLIDRLSSRLGPTAVLQARLIADGQAECTYRYRSATKSQRGHPRTQPKLPGPAQRPVQLLTQPAPIQVRSVWPDGPPRQFHWRGEQREAARYWGPERIAIGWWRGPYVRREYYRVPAGAASH